MKYYRHDLVFANFEKVITGLEHRGLKDLIINDDLPGIVRREEGIDTGSARNYYSEDEMVYIGFVYPEKHNGQRIRFGTGIAADNIERKLTPYDVAGMDYNARTPSLQALDKLLEGQNVGVWGSNALEIITGLRYTDNTSDLDVLKAYSGREDALDLSKCILEIEKEFDTRIDVELILPDGYAINLKEYIQGGETMLAKGLRDVILINRKNIEKMHDPL